METKRKKEASEEGKTNKLPVSGKNPFELAAAADSPHEGEDMIASVACLALNNAPGLLT